MLETLHIDVSVIDRSVTDAETLADLFRRNSIVVNLRRSDNVAEFRASSENNDFDLVFLRYSTIGSTPAATINALQTIKNLPVVVVIEHYDRTLAATLLENGAYDVVCFNETSLIVGIVRRIITNRSERDELVSQNKEYQHAQARLNWLMQRIDQPIAYLRDGIFYETNAAFDLQFGHPQYGEESILDYVEKRNHQRLKQWLQGKPTDNNDSLVTVDWTRPKNNTQSFQMNIGTFQNESYAELLFSQENKTESIATTLPALNGEQFFDIVRQYLAKPETSQIRGWIGVLEIEQYHTHKRRAGWSAIEHATNLVAAYIAKLLPPSVVLSHLGQETFVLLIESKKKEDANSIAEMILEHIRQQPFTVGKQAITLRLSIGLAALFGEEQDIDSVLTAAEAACGIAMKNGGNEIHIYDPQRDASSLAAQEQTWIQRVQEALTYNLFQLAFQPIASLHANDDERYEVLVRIREKDKDVYPHRFLPAVQQTPLITKIDRWVVEQTIARLKQLAESKRKATFFIKLSDATVTDDSFISWLETLDNESQHRQIIFEIGQNVAIALEPKVRNVIKSLRELNYQVVLEHTVDSANALEIIRSLGVQYVKIDGSLIHHLARDKKKQSAIHKIAAVARSSGKQIIAANVQDAESLAVLWHEGVHFIQGFYLQKPSRELDFDFKSLR